MDKVAVIADIHGNIPALEAVLSDIKLRGIANIYCLGDLVGKGPHPDQVVDRIKAVCQEVVMGNWDLDMDKPTDKEDVSWTQGRLGPSRIQYLASLPFCHDFYMSGRLVRLLHASADSVYKRVQPWDSMEERLSMFRNTESTGSPHGDRTPHVVGYGDIHNAYIQHLRQKMLFNAGSVGNPLEMTQASYAILEGVYDCKETAPFSIQLVRVPYEITLAIKHAEESGMPHSDKYIYELRTAKHRGTMINNAAGPFDLDVEKKNLQYRTLGGLRAL